MAKRSQAKSKLPEGLTKYLEERRQAKRGMTVLQETGVQESRRAFLDGETPKHSTESMRAAGLVECSQCGESYLLEQDNEHHICPDCMQKGGEWVAETLPGPQPDPDMYVGNKEGNHIYEIPLQQIRPAPWNPPARMNSKVVEDLAESMLQHGQKLPGLIRPVEADPPIRYELVFGHRRYAAKTIIAGRCASYYPPAIQRGWKKPEDVTFKTFVEAMDEQSAMIMAGIENLQRVGFTDLEEAEFFRTAGERYGEGAVKMLAEKLSVSEKYIRKRVQILDLPEEALQLWKDGTWHVGHMEQLLRLGDNEKVVGSLQDLKRDNWTWGRAKDWPVYQLKEQIDRQAITLSHGRFDKAECKGCRKNTQVQLTLFGGDQEKGAKCLDPKCFEAKQQAWADINWTTCKANKFGTQAVIIGGYDAKITGSFGEGKFAYQDSKPAEKCKSCPSFTTILTPQADTYRDQVCTGDPKCYAGVKTENSKKSKTGAADPHSSNSNKETDAPRVEWHGEYFRQLFYAEQVSQLLEDLLIKDPRRLQLVLAVLVHANSSLHGWFCEKLKATPPNPGRGGAPVSLELWQILEFVRPQSPMFCECLMAEVCVKAAFFKVTDGANFYTSSTLSFNDRDRQAIAEFLDVNWSRFHVSDEWIQKKTKSELVKFIIHESGLAREARFQDAMIERGILSLEKLAAQKKPLLVDLIKNCGVDLRGRLPREIADRPKLGGVEKTPAPESREEPLPTCGLCGCTDANPCSENCDGLMDGVLVAQFREEYGIQEEHVCFACADRHGWE